MNLRLTALTTVSLLAVLPASLGACTAVMTQPPGGSGGAVGSGGTAAGGTASGGVGTGGTGTGGTATGGTASGGAASGGAGTGGAGTGGGDWRDEDWAAVPIGPTFQYVRKITAFWNPTCTGADCHGGTPAHINLIPDAGLYNRLTTEVSDNLCLDEQGMPMRIVVPGEPENSAFLRILRGDCENKGRMPDSCTDPGDCLAAMYTDPIEEWIAMGAPETEAEGGSGGSTGSGGTAP